MANQYLPLGFFSVMAGGVLGIAGVTGSSIHSVIQGKPDKGFGQTASAAEGGGSSITMPPISKAHGKFKKALERASSEIGNPYRWGGAEPGGFDCSGLVQYVFGRVGIKLPRTAQEQYNATRRVQTSQLQPGDLIFFGSSPSEISHVGIYAGENKMIDAPHTGANVRVEEVPLKIGANWGTDKVIGFGEP